MKRIPLQARDGSVREWVLVDDEDFEWLSQWRWKLVSSGYAGRQTPRPNRKTILMHRQIVDFPDDQVDHRNGNGLDNRRSNLRTVTNMQNHQNRRLNTNNKSGFRGVVYDPRRRHWRAQVRLRGKRHHIGSFPTPEAANLAAVRFRREHMPFSEMDTQ